MCRSSNARALRSTAMSASFTLGEEREQENVQHICICMHISRVCTKGLVESKDTLYDTH
jgi:hypothetical protein